MEVRYLYCTDGASTIHVKISAVPAFQIRSSTLVLLNLFSQVGALLLTLKEEGLSFILFSPDKEQAMTPFLLAMAFVV